jgi:hypothetical protein
MAKMNLIFEHTRPAACLARRFPAQFKQGISAAVPLIREPST